MKPRVYLETTIISYLTSSPSRDVLVAGDQRMTRKWWRARQLFALFVSQFVIDEASAGDPAAARARLFALQGIPLLTLTDDATELAGVLLQRRVLPAKAKIDALHVALASVHGLDYLLTWNCAHIANAGVRRRVGEACRAAGYTPPTLCTPFELLEREAIEGSST